MPIRGPAWILEILQPQSSIRKPVFSLAILPLKRLSIQRFLVNLPGPENSWIHLIRIAEG